MTTSPPLARLLDRTADAVAAVRAGRSLTDALDAVDAELRPGVLALASDVMRRLGTALALRARLAPRVPPPPVDALLLSALALLLPNDGGAAYPDHTLVDQAVTAARHRTPAAAGFVNAVLRRFVRERRALLEVVLHDSVAAFNHPLWWIERVRQDWPAQWRDLLAADNQPPPMVLRVNARRGSAQDYVQRLAAHGRAAQVVGPQAVWLAAPCAVAQLPGFAEGDVSVQDLSAQRAAALLLQRPLGRDARVLDACAAPGGKTAHLLELADLDLTALDVDGARLQRVQQNLQRLRLQARLVCADARLPSAWWDGRPFDAVLLDAPCSASGVVRRHPDVRWLRRAQDLSTLARTQAELLDALWPTVAPGGVLLYVTCSIFRVEGEQQIDAFLQRHRADGVLPDPTAPGHLLPLPENGLDRSGPTPVVGDGFFYALIRKPSS
ncbi:MAG TPA: 16S rRNA (cytosine(967)-C(5))-methyltransferase RsmB [Burkholderiaceae bacterium]|nr:16S rRNA (cytosine(967)-C(5))-methyltransferase RsmB [Burkholderiaceae bacterium]